MILVTGGAGYIGSHCVVELARAGYECVVLDNLSNSSDKVIGRLNTLGGGAVKFINADVRDREALDRIFREHACSGVIHLAGLKSVNESIEQPLEYFDNNVNGMLVVLNAMRAAGIKRFIFSSSATVYGDPDSVPIQESAPLRVTNPYGRSKLMCEEILRDLSVAEPDWEIATLRYFNPVGAHESGMLGESPEGIPNNLMPVITQVAVGRREKVSVFGNDYPTPDGTGVRDFIHVVDLALGHVAALRYLQKHHKSVTVNLGTGKGISVKEMIDAFQRVTGVKVAHDTVARRPGDIASCYADPSLAQELMGWRAERTLDEMCRDSWRWQSMNPHGYGDE
jgi:UDP-glucose 4-epimerase